MKMNHYDFTELQAQICRALKNKKINFKKVKADYASEGFSDMRFRWDLLHFAAINVTKFRYITSIGKGMQINLYDYLNDSHIDTALRKIVHNISGAVR